MHVGQAEIASLEFVRQFFMIDAQQMQHRGMQVMHVNRIVENVVAVVVGFSIGNARFDAAAGQPDRKAPGMVVPAVIVFGVCLFHVFRFAEFHGKPFGVGFPVPVGAAIFRPVIPG